MVGVEALRDLQIVSAQTLPTAIMFFFLNNSRVPKDPGTTALFIATHVAGKICKKTLHQLAQKNLIFEDKDFQIAENTLDLTKKSDQAGAAATDRRRPQGVAVEEQGRDARRPPFGVEPPPLATSKSLWTHHLTTRKHRAPAAGSQSLRDGG
jgi:hypothetical protein